MASLTTILGMAPLMGDPMYGSGTEKANMGLTRQFLHSWRLELEHPMTGELLNFVDNLPADLQQVLRELEDRSMGRTSYGEEILAQL